MPAAIKTLAEFAERFWSRVDRTPGLGPKGECWLWTGAHTGAGYGNIKWKGRNIQAQRVAWLLTHGSLPEGLEVCHSCDNPPCVRPDHLFLGTRKQNAQDAVAKGRSTRGERNGHARLTVEAVATIRGAPERVICRELAVRFGVTESAVWQARYGKTWRIVAAGTAALPEPIHHARRHPERLCHGEAHPFARLTEEVVRAIRSSTATSPVLAKQYGVSARQVRAIRSGTTWRHVA